MLILSYSKARRVVESSCLIVTGRDGHTADAEHQRQRRRHKCIAYGPPHGWYAWFDMPAMFGASSATDRG